MISAWLTVALLGFQQGATVAVDSVATLRRAVAHAKPGSTILIAPGTYDGGISLANVHGAAGKPILIAGKDPANPPRFTGGGTGLHLSKVSHFELRDLKIEACSFNGVNIDDGGDIDNPSHHIRLTRINVSDLPKGNHDGIKLSGVDDFVVDACSIQRWGGSAIDMVGCHRGVVSNCTFREGGDNAVQAKGGSSDIRVLKSSFVDAGQRGVNLGGSTGSAYFRPALTAMGSAKYEAKDISVEGCTFVRGGAPIAFVGVDGATVRLNTFVDPGRWVFRILQETREPGFVPCRNGDFADNLIVFSTSDWSSGGVNVGSGTKPESFKFARNFWFCKDRPERSKPSLPMAEVGGTYGIDPKVTLTQDRRVLVEKGSPAAKVGAHAYPGSQ